ncbi:uncharacterized protein dbf4b [Nothobranchius furzeri]|uniref:Pollen-specific leucine-rich repeat extensin-like protein 2 n=2 Tax=Nothobranchius furzeri TaxID=105023 RepID=A0A8C6L4L3_NOTFU|nr:pollen-specific leucine-rich repeat extensin-like protein 2 [Nothobranchius furzeri]
MHSLHNSKERGLLGRLCAGDKKLQGKTFYLDNVKARSTMLILEAISLLGGKIESFLHKDVDFFVTGSQEILKEAKSVVTKGEAKETGGGTPYPLKKQEGRLGNEKGRPETPRPMACGSRGKALLQKAICNNERLQRNALINARSWGVKILNVDDVLLYLKHLSRECFGVKHKRAEKTSSKQSAPAVKAAALRCPYLKIEDASRKYKPLHMQSMTFPALHYSGRFSPFESPPPPRFGKQMDQVGAKKREKKTEGSVQDSSPALLSCNPSPWRPRKKNSSYCECCQQVFSNIEEHLKSDQHRSFGLEPSNYRDVDQLVAVMLPEFDPDPTQPSGERTPTRMPFHDVCELEPGTNVEVKHVQSLLKEDSSFISHISNHPQSHLSSSPASPTLEVNFNTPNPATPPADHQSSDPDANHPSAQLQPYPSSPPMPVLTIETFEHLPDAPCLLSDPYSLPPILSPQVPYFVHILDPQSPYPDPPILSLQTYTTEETFEGQICEMNPADSSVPLSTLLQIYGTSEEGKREPTPEVPDEHTGDVCSHRGLDRAPRSSHGAYSLSWLSAEGSNTKKNCRPESPEHRNLKKRRRTLGGSGSWGEQSPNASKPPKENASNVEDVSLYDASDQMVQSSPNSISTSHFLDVPELKPSCATFSFPSKPQSAKTSQDPPCSHSASVHIEPALIPDLTTHSSALSDSDWDCNFLSYLSPTSATPLTPDEQNCELDRGLLHRSCPWMHDTSYESHLHTVLQPPAPAASLCGQDAESSSFSRTVVPIAEVQQRWCF